MLDPQLFRFDNLANFVGIFVTFFSLLIIVYSAGFMRQRAGLIRYYTYLILTFLASLGAVFANHLILFVVLWGFLALLLYLLIDFGQRETSPATAKKALIIIGGSDALMLLGVALVWRLSGTLEMDKISIALDTRAAIWAYLCFAAGALAKAGCMPLHSWVPDTAEDAPTPVTAYLPASLDKLLGIYFLARISLDMFQLNPAMNTALQALGSITIVAAVMMALIQHDLKRLLGYHAVSQVGYMVLGIGTANPIGIAGGLFHMLNNALYKCCLFLSGGAVEKRSGTTELARLGGLARIMPISFMSFFLASLAISGVPPFNGFASKWMVYQGIIATARQGSPLWVLWLIAAIFGSALTLASFMKAVHTVFLGQPSNSKWPTANSKWQESSPTMWIPSVILAALCILFGVFVYRIPLALFIAPSVKGEIAYTGIWGVNVCTLLMGVGIVIGVLFYILGNIARTRRQTPAFVGGEVLEEHPAMRVSGVEFYETIRESPLLEKTYHLALNRVFDIYEQIKKGCFILGRLLRLVHTGRLTTYFSWFLLGLLLLLYIFKSLVK